MVKAYPKVAVFINAVNDESVLQTIVFYDKVPEIVEAER